MGDLFSSPSSTKPPPVPITPPPPTVEEASQAGEQVRKRRPSGRAETFLTGDLVPEKKKKTVLG